MKISIVRNKRGHGGGMKTLFHGLYKKTIDIAVNFVA
jgi:hypothetical protein